ncbi:MAG: sulfite exporter TauE/SafE family protein [Saprospiraceae bacterium]|nr:sulfite exporter TauE/SafE family protein [Saprospiraceae bacterium]
MTAYEIGFAVIGGFVAGCINTLAGNGSVITLGFLTGVMGLPGHIANGTNRIGIISQGIASIEAFIRHRKIPLRSAWKLLIWGFIGAVFGTLVAIRISADQFMFVFKYLMLALLIFVIANRKQIDHRQIPEIRIPPVLYIPAFFLFGFYGGFIQMGMGILLLAFMVWYMKFPVVEANALKIVMVTSYTVIALPIFHFAGLVDWKIGLPIAIGQSFGGWITAHKASTLPNAALWAYRMLVAIMVFTLFKLFGLLDWLFIP